MTKVALYASGTFTPLASTKRLRRHPRAWAIFTAGHPKMRSQCCSDHSILSMRSG
jgi:hypothetical protein